jgi:biotin transport system substrate-specific component
MSTRVRHVVLIVAGALFVALTAQVVIPTVPVPFTGQTFGVLIVGAALGIRRGALALLLYLALGAIGLPVYAEGDSGTSQLIGATGGYLIGFIVAAAVVGRLAELGWDRHIGGSLAAMAIGTAIIYALGVPWLKAVTGITWEAAVAGGMTKFLIWDAAKLAIAAGIFPVAWWLIGRRPEDR